MALGFGHESYIGIGEESTWGTSVARDKFFEYNSHGLAVEERKLISPSLFRVGIHKDRVVQGHVAVGGDINLNPQYGGGWLRLLKHGMGGLATIAVDPTNAANVRQHTFTIADSLPTGLSVEVDEDTTAFLLEGCKVSQLRFRIATESLLEVTASVIGQEVTTVTATSPTFATDPLIKDSDAVLTWNAGSVCVREAEVVLSNNLTADRRCLNDRFVKEPVRGAKLAVTGRFVAEFENTTLYTDFRNGTNRALRLRFTGSAAQGSYNYEFDMQCNVSKLMSGGMPPVDDAGPIIVEHSFQAFRDATDNELKIIVINVDSSI